MTLKRTGFRRPELPRSRPVLVPRSEPARARMMGSAANEPVVSVPKDNPARDEGYRRLVASFPCLMCGAVGISQSAHANTGKGLAIKASDYDIFPLCGPTPGLRGCHSAFDQAGLMSKQQRREWERWAVDCTRRQAMAAGWQFEEAA